MPITSGIRPYRPDIEGLRSVAILAILLSHAGFTTFSGGDTGLSVFLVVSGYLIADAMMRAGRLPSLGEFYDHRARRLLPTLVVATSATLLAGSVLLTPDEVAGLSRSALASVALASNVAPPGQTVADPLLHTWSVSLAGQIFVLLPLAILACARLPARAVLPLVALASLASFALQAVAGVPGMPQDRLWEFGVGALVAIVPAGAMRPRGADLLAAVGLLAILAPIFLYPGAPTSGLGALPTVIGTALVIRANRRETFARSALGASPLVFLGMISYSLYLWHWPMLVFSRRLWGELDGWATLGCLAATVVVATLSWYFVEQPFRYPTGPVRSRKGVAAASLAGVVTVAALAALVSTEGSVAGNAGVAAAFADVGVRAPLPRPDTAP